ncbi:MAG: hypothetical protein ACRCYU_12025 [Nocardioides sp.]
MDIFSETTGLEAIRWLTRSEVAADFVLLATDAGVRDTVTIEHLESVPSVRELFGDAVKAGIVLTDDEALDYTYVGAQVWGDDPNNRAEWVKVGREVALYEDEVQADPRRSYDRKGPSGRHRARVLPHEIVEAVFKAGRSPHFGFDICRAAMSRKSEIDAFGFGNGLTAAAYCSAIDSGIDNARALSHYLKLGCTIAEALDFAAEGIPATALMMAESEGIAMIDWMDTLRGIPADWFARPDSATAQQDRHYVLTGHQSDGLRLTIADLRHLTDAGCRMPDAGCRMPDGPAFTSGASGMPLRRCAGYWLMWAARGRTSSATRRNSPPVRAADTTLSRSSSTTTAAKEVASTPMRSEA